MAASMKCNPTTFCPNLWTKYYFTGDDALQKAEDFIFQFQQQTLSSFVKVKAPKNVGILELTAEMESVINCAFSPGNSGQVLAEQFKITKEDIATLNGNNWLNDEIINFYMNLLMERNKQNHPKVYAFNTFFYTKLTSGGHAGVKRWTKGVDVLAVDYIIIPVHMGNHWCLAVIDFKKKEIQYFDSMGGNNTQCGNALKKYLCDESLDKKKEFDQTGWKTTIAKDVPRQENNYDCGIFICVYAKYITREAVFTFTQADMPYFRRCMAYEIMTAKLLQ